MFFDLRNHSLDHANQWTKCETWHTEVYLLSEANHMKQLLGQLQNYTISTIALSVCYCCCKQPLRNKT